MSQSNEMTISAGMRKMHHYAIFVLQQLAKNGKITIDFDPITLDISMVNEFNPDDFKQLLKKQKNNTKNITSNKPDIVETIVTEHYNNNPSRVLTRPCTPRDDSDEESVPSVSLPEPKSTDKPKKKYNKKKLSTESTSESTTETPDSDKSTSSVAADPVDELALLVSELAIKPKRKYTRKVVSTPEVAVTEPAAATDAVIAVSTDSASEPVTESASEPVVTENKPVKEDKPKRKYNKKNTSLDNKEPTEDNNGAEGEVVVSNDSGFASIISSNSIVSDIVNASRNPTVLDEPVKKTKKVKKPASEEPTPASEAAPVVVDEPVKKTKKVKKTVSEEPAPAAPMVVEEPAQVVAEEPIAAPMAVEEDEVSSTEVVENVTVNINYTVDDDSRISVVNVTAVNDDTGEIYINNKELEQEPYKEILKEKAALEEGELDEDEAEADEEDDDANEIEAQIIIFENKQYLIDADNIIYDKDSFEEIGTCVNGVIKFNK